MEDLDKTIKVDIARLPDREPPLSSTQKWGLLFTGALVVALVMYYGVLLASDRDTRISLGDTGAQARGLKQGPPIDLVSGEPLEPAKAKFRAEFYGTELYFSSRENLDRFRQDPLAYVKLKTNVNIQYQDPQPTAAEPPEPQPAAEPLATEPAPPVEQAPPIQPEQGNSWSDADEPPPPMPANPEAIPAPAQPAQPAVTDDVVFEEPASGDSGFSDDDIILESEPMEGAAPVSPDGRPGPAGPARRLP